MGSQDRPFRLQGSSSGAPRIVFVGSKDPQGGEGLLPQGKQYKKGTNKKRIPGALRTRNLTPSTSQPLNLSISQLSSLPLTSERARQKFLGVGGCPGQTPRKFCRVFPIFSRTCSPLQLFCCCVQMHQKMHGLQDIVGDLAKEIWFKTWRHVSSPHW